MTRELIYDSCDNVRENRKSLKHISRLRWYEKDDCKSSRLHDQTSTYGEILTNVTWVKNDGR